MRSSGAPPPGWLDVWLEAGPAGRVFTYANPQALPVAIGDLVQVRLQGRAQSGLVVEHHASAPAALAGRLQPLESVLQPAAVDPEWQALMAAVAQHCHTSLFRTLKSALPPGWLGQRPGRRSAAPRPTTAWLVHRTALPPPARCGPRQRQLLAVLEAHGGCLPEADLRKRTGVQRAVLQRLRQLGLLELQPLSPPGVVPLPPFSLHETPRPANPSQAAALEAIAAAPPGEVLLLWGVTGSGKTEVYLQAAAQALAEGRSVLLLTPEIGLVPQLLDRCRARFAARVIEYHSGLSDADRVASWRRALAATAAGEALLAVGTRSAVFLPLSPLGLIVLDEEHDSSYKQESPMPCYHARDVARLRAQRCGARLLLGSATPSLETWLSCRQGSRPTRLLRLPERIGARPLPPVRLVDMRDELADGHRRLLSRPLLSRLEQLVERQEQAVVLVPRRGYRSFLSCRSCGHVVQCPHCDVALTVHRGAGGEWLRCHWCDHRQPSSGRCHSCGSTAFRPFGAGTQRVVERLESELEGLRLLRFDQDTTRGRDGHRRLLERFAAGEADVLVGTQMLAKGMDLPRVTLAAVLAADGLLHRPDLRAAERCLQLLLQLAGRAGRGERPGEVLVQTYSPDHPVIRHLLDGRYERFLEEELELRRQGAQVPFHRACLLRLAGPVATATATAAAGLAAAIGPPVRAAGWLLIGPAPAPVARVAGRSRWQLLLHGPADSPLPLPPDDALRALLPAGVTLAIDPDPLEL
ncbi:MAG: primosomal protein N' [Cyanobacteriota bacterium]|nr:primosomal protein N' [Cyanobacteriota bacterium]